ncbi:hypothetical protein [Nocardia sp. NPDC050175]|uniref:hypothetical protein n=1 Tax=Nocardia sp. NPDC050175 TaxID=3364317 RepID=UPI0037B2F3B6
MKTSVLARSSGLLALAGAVLTVGFIVPTNATAVPGDYHLKMTITGPNAVGQADTITLTGDCVGYPPAERIGVRIDGQDYASFATNSCDYGEWGQTGWTPLSPGDHTLMAYITISGELVDSLSETVTIGTAVPPTTTTVP